MARQHGKGGSITWTAGYKEHVHEWNHNRTLEVADGTEFGMVNRVNDDGLATASGGFTCYSSDTVPLSDVGSRGTLIMSRGGGRQTTAKIVITNRTVTTNLAGNIVVVYSWTLSGTGAADDWVEA